MPDNPTVTTPAGLLESLTKEIPYQQVRLNRDFCDRLAAFRLLLEQVKDSSLEAALWSVAPPVSILQRIELKVHFRAESVSEASTSIRVQPLNLGFTKRFAYAGFSENQLEVVVEQVTGKRVNSQQQLEGS